MSAGIGTSSKMNHTRLKDQSHTQPNAQAQHKLRDSRLDFRWEGESYN